MTRNNVYRVEMVIKRRDGSHYVKEDTYSGDVDGAFSLLYQKYLSSGWMSRFEGRLLSELQELDRRLR